MPFFAAKFPIGTFLLTRFRRPYNIPDREISCLGEP